MTLNKYSALKLGPYPIQKTIDKHIGVGEWKGHVCDRKPFQRFL